MAKKILRRGGRSLEVEADGHTYTAVFPSSTSLTRANMAPGSGQVGEQVSALGRSVFRVCVDDAGAMGDSMTRARHAGAKVFSVYRLPNTSDESAEFHVTDQLTIGFEPDTESARIEAVFEQFGLQLLKQYQGLTDTYLVRVTGDADPLEISDRLSTQSGVRFAEPNLVNNYQTFHEPTDARYDQQWHLSASDGAELSANAGVEAPAAWDLQRGRREVVVAVIDDGFDLDHPDFQGNGKVVFPKDYVDGDARPFPAGGDYHGTPCAGVAIAEENGYGVVGVAPGCAFMPVRFPLTASDDTLIEIFDYVGRRADVISCSWGPGPGYAPIASAVADKLTQLGQTGGPRGKGCVILFAAGNYNAPLEDLDNANGHSWYHYGLGRVVTTRGPILNGFAVHPAVTAVAASTSQAKKATYSNWGQHVALCAPSNNFDPIDPSRRRPGRGIWTTDNERFGDDFTGNSDVTGSFGGTSSATPLAAGIAALVLSENPALTAAEVREILQGTADKISDSATDPYLGHAKGGYDSQGHSEWFGYGKVNAKRAVEEARRRARPDAPLNLELSGAGHLAGSGATELYKLTLGRQLVVDLEGPADADFDVYVRRGLPPTLNDYDKVGYSPDSEEHLVIDDATPGDYYVMVRSYRGTGSYRLKARLS